MNSADTCGALILPIVSVVLLAAAAAGGRKRTHARVTREGGTLFVSERVMQHGYTWIDRLAGSAVRAGVSANAISWLSLALGLGAGILAGVGHLGFAAWALALSGLCDGLDGAVARCTAKATPAGAVLDSALDRYVEFFFCAGLLWFFRGAPPLQLVVVTALFGGFMVTYSTAKAEALQVTPPRGWMKRPERIVWLVAGSAFAGAAPLAGLPREPVVVAAIAVIALFANLSAIIRLRALAQSVKAD